MKHFAAKQPNGEVVFMETKGLRFRVEGSDSVEITEAEFKQKKVPKSLDKAPKDSHRTS